MSPREPVSTIPNRALRATPAGRATRRPAPITRGPRAGERVLRAALEVLAELGVAGFSMEAIAERAGASKATLYRRWTSRAALLVDAMDLAFQPFPLPATGQLRTDLIELVSRQEALLCDQRFPRFLAAVIDFAERDPTLSGLHQQLTERRRQTVLYVLAQAQQRGEIPPTCDLELAVDLLTAPAFYRRFIAHWSFPDDYASAVVDHVLSAIRSNPVATPPESPGKTDQRPRRRSRAVVGDPSQPALENSSVRDRLRHKRLSPGLR